MNPHGDNARCSSDTAGISVVMVSYWTGPVLFAAVDSVLAPDQEGVVELVIVNNGNPDPVAERLALRASTEPRLRVLDGGGNIGFARGCNLGARSAQAPRLLFLNPDCVLGPRAIPALLDEAATLGEHWMLGCRVLNPDGTDQRGSRRSLLTPTTALCEVFRLDRLSPKRLSHFRLNRHEAPLPSRTVRVPAISGACMMLPATTFREVGGFDERYFLHVEDLDLCFRLQSARIPIYFTPRAQVSHHGGTSRANVLSVEWHKTRGFIRYFQTHYHSLRWRPLVVLVTLGTIARFAVRSARLLLVRKRTIADASPGAGS